MLNLFYYVAPSRGQFPIKVLIVRNIRLLIVHLGLANKFTKNILNCYVAYRSVYNYLCKLVRVFKEKATVQETFHHAVERCATSVCEHELFRTGINKQVQNI